jgi:hypothetical protein
MRKKLLLALTASSALVLAAATPALAIHNGWASTDTQGGSTNDCNLNPGCVTTDQPKGQVDNTKPNSSPKEKNCKDGIPAGQCN